MIKRLRVKNFKIHKDTEIRFESFLGILTGENNSGKTSLLEAVMILKECYDQTLRKIQRSTNTHAKAGHLAIGQFDFKPSEFVPYFASVRSENYYELFYQGASSFELEADFQLGNTEFTLAFKVEQGRNQTAFNIQSKTDAANLMLLNQFEPEYLLDVIKSVPVSSVMRNEPYLPPKMLQKHLAENAQVSSLRNRLLQIERLHKLTELQTQLQFIMGFEVFELRIAYDPNEDLYIYAEFRTHKKDPYQDIAMLGSGTLQMLEVLVSLNLAAKSSCRVVLLDEPDSFLHRALQQNLITKLREIAENGVQIISTTHNEQIISSAELSELYHLGNPKQGQKVQALSADLPHGRTTGFIAPVSKSSLYDALGVSASAMNILEAIESDKLILVEGRTDALYLQALQAKRQQFMPVAQPQKVAFWSINGIAQLGDKLKYWKEILSNIKNAKALWDKAQLLIDRDLLDEAEMQAVMDGVKDKFKINTHYVASYTLESSFLLDQAKFKKLLSKLFLLPDDAIEQEFTNWAQDITVENRLTRIQGQRKDRIQDFAPLESTLLQSLCNGNQYNQFIEQLKADPHLLARLADKDDVIRLLRRLSGISPTENLTTQTNEAIMLKLIDQLDMHTWPSQWTGVLKQIYG